MFTSGLRLRLYKEDLEYVYQISSGSGWRLMVHPFNTMPVPFMSGMSLAPGMETYVSVIYVSKVKARNCFLSIAVQGLDEWDKTLHR